MKGITKQEYKRMTRILRDSDISQGSVERYAEIFTGVDLKAGVYPDEVRIEK